MEPPNGNFRTLSTAIIIAALALAFALSPSIHDRDAILLVLLLLVFIPWFIENNFPIIREIYGKIVRPKR